MYVERKTAARKVGSKKWTSLKCGRECERGALRTVRMVMSCSSTSIEFS